MSFLTQWLGNRRLRLARPPVAPVARVAISTRPIFGPWGGANQWLLQISRYLSYHGFVVGSELHGEVDCIFINHNGLTGRLSFDDRAIAAYRAAHPRVRVIHRINDNDLRKGTTEMDALLARYNALADHTVFISAWLRDHHAAKWFDRNRSHEVILNGADASVFHAIGSRAWERAEPFRFVTHHWADNPMKGFAEYAQLDATIAGGALPGVELWVIGRWPAELQWRSARTFGPCAGPALAERLRACHGYLTASRWEPGGMHYIEGLQCGLPIAFHADGGGIPELAQHYGVEFRDDLLTAVRTLRENYATHRQRVLRDPPSGDGMCLAYRKAVQRVLAER